MRNLLPIGRFSQICRLSIPALRHYDELGLLPPTLVDTDTGYRYYSVSQARDADRIRTLRFLEMPLPEIRAILAADPEQTRRILAGHRDRLAAQTEKQRQAIGLLESMMREEPKMTYEIHLRETQPQIAAGIRATVSWSEIGQFVGQSFGEIFHAVTDQGIRFAGPPFALYHMANEEEDQMDVEVAAPVSDPIEPSGRVHPIAIPGGLAATTLHCGAYEDVHLAYEALAEWIQEHGHEMAGACREVYLVGPDQVKDPGGLRTEILWPIR